MATDGIGGGGGGGMAGKGSGGTFFFHRSDPYAALRKFHFTGLIEFRYQDYSTEASFRGHTRHSGWTIFEQIYKLGVSGYIYDPRLAVFSAFITYDNDLSKYKTVSDEWKSKALEYNANLTLLPGRPVSLDLYASRRNTSISGTSISDNNLTYTLYGATMFITHKDVPATRLMYNHWDYTSDTMTGHLVEGDEYAIEKKRTKNKTSYDRFTLQTTGRLRFLRTTYSFSGYYLMISTPTRNFDSYSFDASTLSFLNRKRTDVLSTYFRYQKLDISKMITLGIHLDLNPISHIYQSYNYEYISSETGDGSSQASQKTDTHTLTALLRYRVSSRIYAKGEVLYKIGSDDGRTDNSFHINLSGNYRKPLREFDFYSQYFFSIGNEEKDGTFSFMQHELKIGATTRNLKWATLYSDYDISYRKLSFDLNVMNVDSFSASSSPVASGGNLQTDATDIEQKLRIGANGRGPMRLYWNLELDSDFLDSSDGNDINLQAWRSVYFGETQWAEKLRHYTASADVRFPLGSRGSASMKASYTIGTTNSENVRRYCFMTRINYRLMRNLFLTAWMSEDWKNKGWWAGTVSNIIRNYDWKYTDYEIDLTYTWRRLLFSFEYQSTHDVEGSAISRVTRYYFRLSRRF
jgi:hypothetical protein